MLYGPMMLVNTALLLYNEFPGKINDCSSARSKVPRVKCI